MIKANGLIFPQDRIGLVARAIDPLASREVAQGTRSPHLQGIMLVLYIRLRPRTQEFHGLHGASYMYLPPIQVTNLYNPYRNPPTYSRAPVGLRRTICPRCRKHLVSHESSGDRLKNTRGICCAYIRLCLAYSNFLLPCSAVPCLSE